MPGADRNQDGQEQAAEIPRRPAVGAFLLAVVLGGRDDLRDPGPPPGLVVVERLPVALARHEFVGEDERILDRHGCALRDGDSLIDIGSGHGEALFQADTLARIKDGVGVDFPEVMLKRARAKNRDAVWDTRLAFHCADTVSLPFTNNRFDKTLSVDTVNFWPDTAVHFTEAFRVVRPGGRFVLCYRSTADKRTVDTFPGAFSRFPRVQEVEKTMAHAAFVEIKTTTDDIGRRLTHRTFAKKPRGLLTGTSGLISSGLEAAVMPKPLARPPAIPAIHLPGAAR